MLEDADAAGASGVASLRDDRHVHRNLVGRLLPKSKWPRLYYARCRTTNTESSTEEFSNIPRISPRELLSALVQHAVSRPNLSGVGGMDLYTPGLFKKASRDLGLDARKIIGLSFWLDGVALKWDRSDMLTMSIPGLVGPWRNLGVPLCVIDLNVGRRTDHRPLVA